MIVVIDDSESVAEFVASAARPAAEPEEILALDARRARAPLEGLCARGKTPRLILFDVHIQPEIGSAFIDWKRGNAQLKHVPFYGVVFKWEAVNLRKAGALNLDRIFLLPESDDEARSVMVRELRSVLQIDQRYGLPQAA